MNMTGDTFEIKGTEYKKGDPVIVGRKVLCDNHTIQFLKSKNDGLRFYPSAIQGCQFYETEDIGYLRGKKKEENIEFVCLASSNPDITDKLTPWNYSERDTKIREDWITYINKVSPNNKEE